MASVASSSARHGTATAVARPNDRTAYNVPAAMRSAPSRAEGKRPRIEGVSGGHVVFPPGGGRFSIAILLHSVWPDRKCDQNGVSRTMTLFLRLLGSSAEGRVVVVPPLSRFAVAALPSFSERLSAVERRAASPSFERASSVLVDVRKAVVRPEGLSLSRCALATSD